MGVRIKVFFYRLFCYIRNIKCFKLDHYFTHWRAVSQSFPNLKEEKNPLFLFFITVQVRAYVENILLINILRPPNVRSI